MIKKNLKLMVITSLVILLPIAAGLILWPRLPRQLPIHWDLAGQVDNYAAKELVVLGFPLLLLALQWICSAATSLDPKRMAHSEKMLKLILWLIPALSVVLHAVIYAAALGSGVRVETIAPILLGPLLAITGNYMPKCRQNYTIGLKLPWTLNSEANWNQTHRFGGRVWLAGGLLMILAGLLGSLWAMIVLLVVMIAAPILYSLKLHLKGV